MDYASRQARCTFGTTHPTALPNASSVVTARLHDMAATVMETDVTHHPLLQVPPLSRTCYRAAARMGMDRDREGANVSVSMAMVVKMTETEGARQGNTAEHKD